MTQKQGDVSKNFLKLGKLGQGTFGVVQRVLRIADNQQYALKTVKYQDLKEKNKKNALNEVSMLSEIEHPNIIRFKCAFFDSETKSLCTLMELAPNGDLASRIKQKVQNYSNFSEQQIWAIGRDIIHGIQALHKKNIIHRDIKPANILFGEADVAKIGDLNVSVKMNNDDIYLTNQTGTPYYASPEVWSNQLYSFDCDVWSFGCVIYELCTLNKPFEGKNLDRLYRKIIRLKYDPIPYRYSSDLSDVIESCLQNRKKRISVEQLKRIFDLHNKPLLTKQSTDAIKSPLSLYNYRFNTEISIEDQFAPKSPFCGYLNLNPEQKIELNTETSISSRKCVLDKYLKPERKLPSSKYYQSPKSVMSLKYLPPYRQPLDLVQRPQIRQLSFLRSPLKSPAYPQNLDPLHHHFRNRRARLQYF